MHFQKSDFWGYDEWLITSRPPSMFTLKLHTYTLHFPVDDSYPTEWDVFGPKPFVRSTVERRVVEKNQEHEEMPKSTRNPDFGTLYNFLGFQVMGQYFHCSLL